MQTQQARKRAPFLESEDKKLIALVARYGEDDWGMITKYMIGRNVRQCRERWNKYLNPNLKKDPWTEEEDNLLMKKYYEIGPRWKEFSYFFQSRTDLNIRNRFKRLKRRMIKDGSKIFEFENAEISQQTNQSIRNSSDISNQNDRINNNDNLFFIDDRENCFPFFVEELDFFNFMV